MCIFDQETNSVKDKKGNLQFDIYGEPLEVNIEGEYTDIPDKCPECNCKQTENWKEYTSNTIQVCLQCGNEMMIIY